MMCNIPVTKSIYILSCKNISLVVEKIRLTQHPYKDRHPSPTRESKLLHNSYWRREPRWWMMLGVWEERVFKANFQWYLHCTHVSQCHHSVWYKSNCYTPENNMSSRSGGAKNITSYKLETDEWSANATAGKAGRIAWNGLSNSKFSILDANSSYKPHGIKSITWKMCTDKINY